MTMGTGPFSEVVIGVADLDGATEFLALFGLVESARRSVGSDEASAVFGLEQVSGDAVRLASPLAPDRATVLLVPTDVSAPPRSGWQLGPRALDLYTTDLDRSTAAARNAGWTVSPEAALSGGPMRMRQAMVHGPDAIEVVLVESTHRRSSVCDLPAAPQHSEPHSVVWAVAAHAAELDRWVAAGWTPASTISFSEASVSDELSLPERPTPITMSMVADPAVQPIRLELMTFDEHQDPLPDGPPPLSTGLFGIGVAVESITATVAAWADGASFGPVVSTAEGRTSGGFTAGGVRLILTERG